VRPEFGHLVSDKEVTTMLTEELIFALQVYIEEHQKRQDLLLAKTVGSVCEKAPHPELDQYVIDKRKPTFNQILFGFIEQKSLDDVELYKKAGLDRRHFSKIRTNPDYRPRKNTVIALAMALELDKRETDHLLTASGYSLSESDTFDLVIQFCLEQKIYDLDTINQALNYFRLKPLAGVCE
jgi:hypothetical protein